MGALTTLASVNLHLFGATTGTSDDALLTQKIKQASSWIEDECGRTLTRETRTAEKYSIDGDTFYLDLYPVESISAITVDGVTVTDYELSPKSGKMYRESGWGDVVVTYIGGYALADITGPPAIARNLPDNLENAAILWVACAYNSRGSEHLSDESIGPLKSVFWKDQPTIDRIIQKYRRVSV